MFMKKLAIIACVALSLLLSACARETRQGTEATTTTTTPARDAGTVKPVRVSADGTDAAEPSLAPARDGTAYIAWVEHRENKDADVMLAHLDADGQLKNEPVRVNPKAGEATAWRGDAPTVAVSPDGAIHVGWTARVASAKNANELYLSTSRDGGRSFEPPVRVNDDGKAVEHGMHSLAVSAEGRVYVAWLDERNVVKPPPAHKENGQMKMDHMEANREVFLAASADGGRSFSTNTRIGREACPCCKTALATGSGGRVYASWRQVLPGEFRHIALAASADEGKTFSAPKIVSDDRWMIAACPVSGPALSAADDGALRVVWYTEGDKGAPGIYWAESRDHGETFSESTPLAEGEARGNPFLLTNGKGVATVIWESNQGGSPRVMSAQLAGNSQNVSAAPMTTSGELPSATLSGDQLFVGYIAKINDRRSIWIMRAKPVA
jgi:hypothetical protein